MGGVRNGRMAHELYGTSVVVLRTLMTYGPRQLERKFIPATILSLLRQTPPRLSSGERRLDWIYVDDAIDAYIAAAIAPQIEGETLDVGSAPG